MSLTPAQALANLDGVAARAPLTRADHMALVESVNVLQALVTAQAEKPAPAGNDTSRPGVAP